GIFRIPRPATREKASASQKRRKRRADFLPVRLRRGGGRLTETLAARLRIPSAPCDTVLGMSSQHSISRRSFLAATAAAPLLPAFAQSKRIPVGIEMYSVRDELTKDLLGTTATIAKMGYQVMEYYSPYFNWTTDQAKQVRAILDEHGAK